MMGVRKGSRQKKGIAKQKPVGPHMTIDHGLRLPCDMVAGIFQSKDKAD